MIAQVAVAEQSKGLRSLADNRKLLFGVACNYKQLFLDQQYRNLIEENFNLLVPERSLKLDKLDYKKTDFIVEFAHQHQMELWGGALVWHRAVPTNIKEKPEDAEKFLRNYITETVERYKNSIVVWDVVNEVLADDSGVFRNSFWLDTIGKDYVKKAFVWARQANPDAQLYINDYRLHYFPHKRRTLLELAQSVGADGVGIQFHHKAIAANISLVWLSSFLQELQNQQLKSRLSEVTIWTNPSTVGWRSLQAIAYRRLIEIVIAHECNEICVWGLNDAIAWRDPQLKPFLFDESYQPKLAYKAIQRLLQGEFPIWKGISKSNLP